MIGDEHDEYMYGRMKDMLEDIQEAIETEESLNVDEKDKEMIKWAINKIEEQEQMLNTVKYFNEKNGKTIYAKDLAILLLDLEILEKENEKLRNADLEEKNKRIEELELFINDYLELSKEQIKSSENAKKLLKQSGD